MALRRGHRLGKYRIERKLATGGFAEVYEAKDTVEGIRVALKIPLPHVVSRDTLEGFRKEVRLTAGLDHPSILPVKTAEFIDGRFVVVSLLGKETLGDRLRRRMGPKVVLEYAVQILEALAHAHARKVVHCDLKDENFILFPGNRLRLTDFGIARIALRTLDASGSGTVGYLAPEQALGKPSLRSDVFAAGLLIWQMMSGVLPEWPFHWPPRGFDRVSRRYHPDLLALLRRAMEVDERKRFADAGRMLRAFRAARRRALLPRRKRRKGSRRPTGPVDWKALRIRHFRKEHAARLEARQECAKCGGPVAEAMRFCPWCTRERARRREPTRFPARCPRCLRGLKLDWRYCPWCWGAAVGPATDRTYSDSRYGKRCGNGDCTRRLLLPFMRYCPWCRSKVAHRWRVPGSRDACGRCGWGVLPDLWTCCPWCRRALKKP